MTWKNDLIDQIARYIWKDLQKLKLKAFNNWDFNEKIKNELRFHGEDFEKFNLESQLP